MVASGAAVARTRQVLIATDSWEQINGITTRYRAVRCVRLSRSWNDVARRSDVLTSLVEIVMPTPVALMEVDLLAVYPVLLAMTAGA
jgi:hypothetical protein